ncbi:MAG: Hsp20/alpha crystallin family protein [Lewinellaceae bacterium]|nr:Hsp20/alpha crystallin family protein [Saprospiraceae bacterium]MCB9337612.1 Hsp20/alpha crystallin family protein [Lewinellaceae bacterium]
MCYRKSFHPHWGMDKEKFMHGGHFGRHFGGQMARHPRSRGYFPPVNVLEADDKYELYVYAPGLAKSDFNINLKDDVLTIATRRQESDLAAANPNWRRQEYRPEDGFERSFVLNEKVDTANISANYTDGVLVVALPKLPGTETKRQDVYVA